MLPPFSSFSNTVSEYQLFFNFFPGGWNLHVPDFIAYSSLSQVVSLQDTGLTCHLQPVYTGLWNAVPSPHLLLRRDAPSLIRIMYISILFLCRKSHIGLQKER